MTIKSQPLDFAVSIIAVAGYAFGTCKSSADIPICSAIEGPHLPRRHELQVLVIKSPPKLLGRGPSAGLNPRPRAFCLAEPARAALSGRDLSRQSPPRRQTRRA